MSRTAGEAPRSFDRFMAWLSHWQVHLMAVIPVCGVLGLAVAPLAYLTTVGIFVMVAGMIGEHYHHHRVYDCGRCAKEFPYDGSAQAERKARILWRAHHVTPVGVAQILCLIGGLAFVLIVREPWAAPATYLTYFPWAYLTYVRRTHNRLVPWCPLCQGRGGGGMREIVPDPQPTGEKTQ